MAIEFHCECGKRMTAKNEWAGKKSHCPSCHATIIIPRPAAPEPEVKPEAKPAKDPLGDPIPVDFGLDAPAAPAAVATARPGSNAETATFIQHDQLPPGLQTAPSEPDHPAGPEGTHQYKVLTPKDYGIAAKFNPETLEKTLNDMGRKGWALKSTAVMSVATHGGSHDELILILER